MQWRTGAVALGALCGGLKGRQAAKKAAKAESDLKDYCRNNLCSKWQSQVSTVNKSHRVGIRCPHAILLPQSTAPTFAEHPAVFCGPLAAPRSPLHKINYFFYTLTNPCPWAAESQNQPRQETEFTYTMDLFL